MTTLQMQDYWLGMRINGGRYAISTKLIQAVFLHPESEQMMKDLRINGVVVYKGEPICLRNHFQLLRFDQRGDSFVDWQQVLKQSSAPWVIVLRNGPQEGLGFRVNNIVGPFYAETIPDSSFFYHNGADYHLVGVS
ncbi:hypothetical protein [Polynucleobacter sp. Nonnen-W13]|uniref:hypothetical protein n=1 Tax=Polynucleobacter sp. Nonnen-W13 TaxID=1855625 RepID=UPI001C0B4EEB|nr:hypothetical protein [Polynucleobacter sp. Nonnen-W13]MBU3558461.1 hypothetical protein [Polynucleobacter sp. Nonnen-W13]